MDYNEMEYNVVIIGGGTAGVAAAYALAQLNGDYKIALVEKQEILGGTAVNGLVYDWIQGINPPYFEKICYELGKKDWCKIYKRSDKNSALVLESCVSTEDLKYTWLGRRFYEDAAEGNFSNDEGHIFFEPWKLAEKYESDLISCGKIDILKGFSFCSANSMDGNVKEIVVKKGQEVRHIIADFFIDCSADGVLCRYVNGEEGKDYYIGLDRRETYDEDVLIENDPSYDTYKMEALIAPSLFFEIVPESEGKDSSLINTDREAADKEGVSAEGYAFKYVGSTSIRTCNPMGGLGISGEAVLQYDDTEALRKAFIERVPAYWELVKDKSWAKGWAPRRYAKMPGIRETYRIECEKMLTLSDLEQNVFERIKAGEGEDIIAVGSHPVDSHGTIGCSGNALNEFNDKRLKPYGISYYSLVPKKLNNVWIACRAFGASHLALSSARINKVMAQLGWAAGNAARYCLEKQKATNKLELDDILCLRTEEYTAFDKQAERALTALRK